MKVKINLREKSSLGSEFETGSPALRSGTILDEILGPVIRLGGADGKSANAIVGDQDSNPVPGEILSRKLTTQDLPDC